MNFRIADIFTASLAKLTGNEQKAVKTTAFDLQLNPAHPGMQFHKLNAARDPNFCSLRVNRDIRLIVHRSADNLLLCYVDHHDKAYRWAERRRLETHPKTGAAQLVEALDQVAQDVGIDELVDLVAKIELGEDFLHVERETVEVGNEVVAQALTGCAGLQLGQREVGDVVEGLARSHTQRAVLFSHVVRVKELLSLQHPPAWSIPARRRAATAQ